MKMNVLVSEKGQVTIPKALRRRLGINAGVGLHFTEERGRLVATKVVDIDPLDALVGAGIDARSDDLLDELRGPRGPARRRRVSR